MPVLDGVDTTRRLRVEHREVRVLVLTTFDGDDEVFPALRAGAVGYLLKDAEAGGTAAAVPGEAPEEAQTPSASVTLVPFPGRWAYLEMTLSMVVGMGLFGAIWDGVWPGLTGRPDAMALTMAFDMTLGMASWMWVRRHPARHVVEMSVVMALPFLVLLCPYWLGVLPGDALLTWGHVAMFALMGILMAWRPHTSTVTPALNPRGHSPMSRPALLSSALLVGGAGLAVAGGILHPHDQPPNSHAAVFAEYAHSTDWVWVTTCSSCRQAWWSQGSSSWVAP